MIDVSIDDKLKERWPNAKLGCIQAKVAVNKSSEKLINEINEFCDTINQSLKVEDITKLDKIKDARNAYKELGKIQVDIEHLQKHWLEELFKGRVFIQ